MVPGGILAREDAGVGRRRQRGLRYGLLKEHPAIRQRVKCRRFDALVSITMNMVRP